MTIVDSIIGVMLFGIGPAIIIYGAIQNWRHRNDKVEPFVYPAGYVSRRGRSTPSRPHPWSFENF